jgi:hypothetical protein
MPVEWSEEKFERDDETLTIRHSYFHMACYYKDSQLLCTNFYAVDGNVNFNVDIEDY